MKLGGKNKHLFHSFRCSIFNSKWIRGHRGLDGGTEILENV